MFYLIVPAPFLNDAPEPDQVLEISFQRVASSTLRDGPHDGAALETVLNQQFLDEQTQTLTLSVLVDARRNADARASWQQDQVTRRQRYERRQPRTLVAERILDDLDQQAVPFPHEFPYVRQFFGRSVTRIAVPRNIRGMQECRTIESNLHECGLHAGKNARHPSIVDITDQAAARRAFDEDFLQYPVLEQCRPGFRRRHVDQDLLFSRLVAHIASFNSAGGSIPAARNSSAVSRTGSPTTPV